MASIGQRISNTALYWIAGFENVTAAAGASAILVMALIITYGVVMRYVFNSPPNWTMEISRDLLIFCTLMVVAYTLRVKGHVRSDIVTSHLPIKLQVNLDRIASITGAVYCGVLAWGGTLYVLYLYEHNVTTLDLGAPLWPVMLSVPVAASSFGLRFIIDLAHSVGIGSGGQGNKSGEEE